MDINSSNIQSDLTQQLELLGIDGLKLDYLIDLVDSKVTAMIFIPRLAVAIVGEGTSLLDRNIVASKNIILFEANDSNVRTGLLLKLIQRVEILKEQE